MADQRRGKRKSPCLDFFSEISEVDLSPEHPNGDPNEPDSKIAKMDKKSMVTKHTTSWEMVSNLDQVIINKLETRTEVEVEKPICDSGLSSVVDNEKNENTAPSSKILASTSEGIATPSKTNPSISITFGSQEVADIYKSKFLRFMESFAELNLVKSEDPLTLVANRDELLNDNQWVIVDGVGDSQENPIEGPKVENKPLTPAKKRKKKNKNKHKKEPEELFVVDTNPSVRSYGTDVQYSSKFVIEEKGDEKEVKVERIRAQQACFNCGEGHSLRDCTRPRDQNKIRSARAKFTSSYNKSTRYHLEEDQKYGHMKPGTISDRLRKAMGLHNNEMPSYIYRMRTLGYPPGWLEEAKVVNSNLDMFDIHGKNVRNSRKTKQGLDPEKIVEYPGFNAPPMKGFRDEYKRYDVPPYSRQFSKETMLNYFENEYMKQQDDLEAYDMEMEDKNDANESENAIVIDDSEERDSKYNIQPRSKLKSPSLTDLEQKKIALLSQLDDSTSSQPGTPSVVSTDKPDIVVENKPDIIIVDENLSETSMSDAVTEEHSQSTCESDVITILDDSDLLNTTPANISLNAVKQSSFGTPVLKSSSPYARLPNMDNFTKDVSPVINFENLPNSTGTYEQMSGIIKKVRSTMKKLQGQDESKT